MMNGSKKQVTKYSLSWKCFWNRRIHFTFYIILFIVIKCLGLESYTDDLTHIKYKKYHWFKCFVTSINTRMPRARGKTSINSNQMGSLSLSVWSLLQNEQEDFSLFFSSWFSEAFCVATAKNCEDFKVRKVSQSEILDLCVMKQFGDKGGRVGRKNRGQFESTETN